MRPPQQPPPDKPSTWVPPEGFEIEWVEEDPKRWRFATTEETFGKKCRRIGCQHPPVAALNRGRHTNEGKVDSWWFYCGCHLYGRVISMGGSSQQKILVRRVVKVQQS